MSLVPQSGIQIVDLRCDLASLPRLTRPFWEEELREDLGPDGRPRIILRALEADQDGALFDPVTGTRPRIGTRSPSPRWTGRWPGA